MTLLDALRQFVGVTLGTFAVLGGWILLQNYVRRRSGCRPDHDVLDYMAHNCVSCLNGQTCKNRMKTAGLNPGTEHKSS